MVARARQPAARPAEAAGEYIPAQQTTDPYAQQPEADDAYGHVHQGQDPYDPQADGWLVREKADADDVGAARETALSYAAYRLLLHRYSYASGLQETFDELVRPLFADGD